MQNDLIQVLTLVAMEQPVTLSADDIRDEKVKVLRRIKELNFEDVIIGQYVESKEGGKMGYLEDPSVTNKNSLTPTYAIAVLFIDNERWAGVPFFLKCGKALNEQKAEVRIQFNNVPGGLFEPSQVARNELVLKIQPDEAVYMKMVFKKPGLAMDTIISELDLSYSQRYGDVRIPDAYESLILDILRGDHSNFVRNDELDYAWKIFTPLLHYLDDQKVVPEPYAFGSRGPVSADRLIASYGFTRGEKEYIWKRENSIQKNKL